MSKPKSAIPNLGDLAAMWQASGLKEKLIFTIAAIAVYRLGAQIPIWGIDPKVTQDAASTGLLGFLDMFSGGALGSLSILALGIGPYITASIVMQLLTVVIPKLEELQKDEGEQGRRKISQYTRYLTVALSLVQGMIVLKVFSQLVPDGSFILPGVEPMLFYPGAILTLMGGAIFALWLAELISDRGIGNGGSLLIFVGIIAGIPFYAQKTMELVSGDAARSFNLIILLAIFLAAIAYIIVLQEAVRKIFIVSSKRQVGNKVYQGQNSFIPFKINPAGVMPIIFTFAILAFPQTIMQFIGSTATEGWLLEVKRFYDIYLDAGTIGFIIVQFVLIIFFTFFYASIIPSMQPREIAENLRKYGSAIPGVKPGKPTADKLEEVLTRITFIGAIGLALITLITNSAASGLGISTLSGLGASALIILVGVALDTMNQIRVHLLSRQYEGFMKSAPGR